MSTVVGFECFGSGAVVPTESKFGLEIRCTVPAGDEFILGSKSTQRVFTGLRVKLPPNTVGILTSQNTPSHKIGIKMDTTIIYDDDEIVITLVNNLFRDYHIVAGNIVAYLLIQPTLQCIPAVIKSATSEPTVETKSEPTMETKSEPTLDWMKLGMGFMSALTAAKSVDAPADVRQRIMMETFCKVLAGTGVDTPKGE